VNRFGDLGWLVTGSVADDWLAVILNRRERVVAVRKHYLVKQLAVTQMTVELN